MIHSRYAYPFIITVAVFAILGAVLDFKTGHNVIAKNIMVVDKQTEYKIHGRNQYFITLEDSPHKEKIQVSKKVYENLTVNVATIAYRRSGGMTGLSYGLVLE